MIAKNPIRTAIDWGELAPLRLRARQVAEGVYAGVHRSALRGAGVEFGGYREYVPGDDLRWLDRRSLLRHDRLVVRQFETETDPNALASRRCVGLDGLSRVSGPGGEDSPSRPSSRRRSRASRWPGANRSACRSSPAGRWRCRWLARAVAINSSGSSWRSSRSRPEATRAQTERWSRRPCHSLVRSTRRGAIVVVLSDLLDLPENAADRISEIAPSGRVLVVVQTLDPAEVDFPFTGTVRLRSLEGGAVVETDAATARTRYLEALEALTARWRDAVVGRGGRFVRATSADAPIQVVREIVRAVR